MGKFQKATKSKARARIGLQGPSGSGKTYTALEWATVLATARGSRIALIDTERDSASLYADVFDFDTLNITKPYHPNKLVQALQDAEAEGYEVVVIDSGSHFWSGPGGVLEIVDAAKSRYGGNSHMAWAVGTPVQQAMVDALLAFPGDVLFTMRSKSEYLQGTNGKGQQTMQKVGTTAQQRDGIEYEMTLMLEVDLQHRATVSKTRCPSLADRVWGPGDAPSAAGEFLEWLNSGAETERVDLTPLEAASLRERLGALSAPVKNALWEKWKGSGIPSLDDLRVADLPAVLALLDAAEKAPGSTDTTEAATGPETGTDAAPEAGEAAA